METIKQRYDRIAELGTDIKEHLPVLMELAVQCKHVTEIGSRDCISTTALYYGLSKRGGTGKKLVCYDIDDCPAIQYFEQFAEGPAMPEFEFHRADSRKVMLEPTDLLFIDSYHSYQQLQKELELHADKAKKFIAMHDTTKYGEFAEHGPPFKGLWPAIEEFLAAQTGFVLDVRHENQNGLTVLKRLR